MKVKLCILLTLVILVLTSCGASTIEGTIGESVRVGDFDVTVYNWSIGETEYYEGAGYYLLKVGIRLINQGDTAADFIGSYSGYMPKIRSGDKIYDLDSSNGVKHDIQPLQETEVLLIYHIPNALAEADDELVFTLTQHDGYNMGDKAEWKLR